MTESELDVVKMIYVSACSVSFHPKQLQIIKLNRTECLEPRKKYFEDYELKNRSPQNPGGGGYSHKVRIGVCREGS